MKNQLIQLYLLVCQIYDSQSCLKSQRLSNFKPRFTDQELITIYLFGHLNGLCQKKAIYRFTQNYWSDWFPSLPSYQAFNRRLNLLERAFHAIAAVLLDRLADGQSSEFDHLIDSMPVMLASGSFSRRARVAREIANRGYCAAKRLHFHGVRLHFIASRRNGRLPLPKHIWLREASVHDLTSVKQRQICLPNSTLIGDKAFCDTALKLEFKQQNTLLLTPKKKAKGKELNCFEKQYNQLINRLRQPIESFFNWLIDKTQIQRASLVRSTDGLLIHCFGKLTFALLLLVFYS
jgi:Transposase DDE domain